MKNKVIVGYQGIKYCNNYYAVLDIVEQFKQVHPDTEVEIIPLEHSDKVIAALKKKEIDYGTMAFTTDLGIKVKETEDALKDVKYEVCGKSTIDVHHCLFKKNADIPNDEIRVVSSHPEAIRECTMQISYFFPKAIHIPYETTGIAARDLGAGILPDNTAVVCSKEAGLSNGLCLVKENAETISPNNTYFYMIKLEE